MESFPRQPLRISPISSGSRTLKLVDDMGHYSGYISGVLSPFAQNAATAIRDSREREKKEISDLNDRLAGCIEKVRFLEAQNRKIQADLEALRGRWGKDTYNIRKIYESELKEAGKLITETSKAKDDGLRILNDLSKEVQIHIKKLSNETRERVVDKDRIAELSHRLSHVESEINFYQRRIATVDEEVRRIKNENSGVTSVLQRSRIDLDQETLNRIDQQNQVQTLLEEVEFLQKMHQQELRDLRSMAARDTTSENQEFFKNELSEAIRDIRQEYDQINNLNRNDIENWYRLKVQEIHTQSVRQHMEKGYAHEEVKRLRAQSANFRTSLADLESRVFFNLNKS